LGGDALDGRLAIVDGLGEGYSPADGQGQVGFGHDDGEAATMEAPGYS
jgi:hypothetical protein